MKEILIGLRIAFICCITFYSLNAQDYYLKSFAKRPQIDYWLDGVKSFPKKQTKDWHATRSKKAALNASFNYNKFKRSFPEIRTAMEYVSGAHFFKTNGPDGMLDKKMENGDHVFYDESNNICVVYAPSGLPKTMFRPKEGMIYFNGLGGDDPKYIYEGINEKYAANAVASNSGYNAMPDECFKKDRSGKYSKIDFGNNQYDDFKNSKIFIKEKARYIQVTQDADGNGVLDNMNLFYKKNGTKITPIPPGYANDDQYQSTAIFTRTSAGFKKVPRDLVMATEEYSQVGTANDPYSEFVDNGDNDSNANDSYGKVPEKSHDQYEEPDEDDAVYTKRGNQYVELTIRELKSPKFVPVPVYAEFNGKHFEVTKDADHDGYYDDFPLSILKSDGTFEPVPPGYANQYEYKDKDFYFPGMGVMLRIPKPLVMATETYAEDSVDNALPTYGDAANVRPPGNSTEQYDLPPSEVDVQNDNYDLPPAEVDVQNDNYDLPPAEVDVQNDNYDLPPAEVDPRAGQYDDPPAIPNEHSDAAQYDVVPPEEKGSRGYQNKQAEKDPTKNLDYFAKAKGSQWHPISGQDWKKVHEAQWDAYNNQFRNLKSKEEYFAVALGFLYKAPKSTLSKKMKNGHLIKYHEASNLFAVYDEKNRPITMFKPDNGIKLYYEKTGTSELTQGHYQAADIKDDYQNIPIYQKKGSQYTKVPHRNLENGNYTPVPAFVKHKGKYVQVARDKNHDDLYDNIPLFVNDKGNYVPVPNGQVFNTPYSNLPIFSKINGTYIAIPPSLVKATEHYTRAPAKDQYTRAPANDQYTRAPSPVYQKFGGTYKAVPHRDLKSGQYSPAPAYVKHKGKYIKVAADADHNGVFDDFQVFMKNREGQYLPVPPGQVFNSQYSGLPIFKKVGGQYLAIPAELVAGTEEYLGIGKN